jgi:large conductance mechanosensitive channel
MNSLVSPRKEALSLSPNANGLRAFVKETFIAGTTFACRRISVQIQLLSIHYCSAFIRWANARRDFFLSGREHFRSFFMGMIQEFKQFVQRGNVVDLAVGVIMGGAFGKIVNSLVADVLMPPIGYVVGGIKFTDLKFTLPPMTIKVPDPAKPGELVERTLEAATINYGNFLQNAFDFLIIAFCIFILVKAMNSMQKKAEEAPPAPPEPSATEKLLTEIRDALKAKS